METNFTNFTGKIRNWRNPELLKLNPDFKSDLIREGTHVKCLPNENYLKKHWNKIVYITIDLYGNYVLHDMSHLSNSNKGRLEVCGVYSPIFWSQAKTDIHFEWLEHGDVYNQHKGLIRKY